MHKKLSGEWVSEIFRLCLMSDKDDGLITKGGKLCSVLDLNPWRYRIGKSLYFIDTFLGTLHAACNPTSLTY